MEDKKDYLIRTLSRTKRKDYENYVINRLYNRLNDLDIKPMTQKYIKRGKFTYFSFESQERKRDNRRKTERSKGQFRTI